MGGAGAVQQLAGGVAALFGNGEQKVLGGDKFVLEPASLVKGMLEYLVHGLGEINSGLHTGRFGQAREHALGFGKDRVGMHAAFFQHGTDDAFLLFRQGDQEVEREDDLASIFFREGLALLHGLLGFLSQLIQTKH